MITLTSQPASQDSPHDRTLPEPNAAIHRWPHSLSRRKQVYQAMVTLIRSGMLRAGDALPSERMLGRVFDMARGSVRMVLDDLTDDGVVRISQGKKTLVTGAPLPGGASFQCAFSAPVAQQGLGVIEHARRLVSAIAIGADLCQVDARAAGRLGLLVDMQHATSDLPEFMIIDRQFHTDLQTCDPTRKFARLLRLASELAHGGLRDAFEAEAVRREIVEQHRAIVLAIERHAVADAVFTLCAQLEMRIGAYRAFECETPGSGRARSNRGVAQTPPLQDVLGTWRRCGDTSWGTSGDRHSSTSTMEPDHE